MSHPIKRLLVLAMALAMILTAFGLNALAEDSGKFANGETLIVYYPCSALVFSKYNSYDEHPAIQLMEEYTGLDLQFIHPPQDDDGTYFSTVVASGMWPDIWRADFSNYPGDVDSAISDGLIININQYVDEAQMPNFWSYYSALDDVSKKNFVNDNGIFTGLGVALYPEELILGEQHQGPVVRSDILEELGIESPVSMEDFTDMLYALKDYGFETPLGLYKFSEFVAYRSNFICGGFGVMINTTTGFIVDEDGSVKYSMIQPGYKEFLTYLNQLYADGIIDRDFVNRSEADTRKLMFNGTVACMAVGNWETREIQQLGKSVDERFDIAGIALPRLDADAPYGMANPVEQGDYANGFQISTTCEYPELCIKWIDFLYSDYGIELTNYGPSEYDGHDIWSMVDGRYVFSDYIQNNPEIAFNALRSWYSIDNMQMVYHPDYQMIQYDAPICWQCWDAWGYNVSNDGHVPDGIKLTADESNEVVKRMDSISAYSDEMTYKFILGEESMDNWDAFVKQVEDLGIAEVEAIYTAANARYFAR